ncbi:MAG: M3 family metallopeptidase, partial [Bacteroidales bacterium]
VRGFAIAREGKNIDIMPWDWSFYSEKLKDSKFQINDEMLRPYFELSNVTKGVFGLATDLFGVTFKENKKIQVYHPEVKAYEVFDKNGKFLAVLYTDFHPRAGKRPGAWMTEFKGQYKENGKDSRPHVTIVMNFTRPTADTPALLTYDEVETFLHEFGHALHGIFANTTYESMSGTSVYRDFVELPSQILENWLPEKEFLDKFAVHYQTGEKIPAEYIEKIVASNNFNTGYLCLRQLSFGMNDMAWHTINEKFDGDMNAFEQKAIAPTQMFPVVEGTSLSPQFSHIFAGGYAAGYYSYKWAEVLDADAFALFKEKGIFNQDVANKFLETVLSQGGTVDPMVLYVQFRGQEPTVKALMERSGIKM